MLDLVRVTDTARRTVCRKAMDDERRRVQLVVESIPKRLAAAEKQKQDAATNGPSSDRA